MTPWTPAGSTQRSGSDWHRIAVPPEFTEVVYVYRNVTNRLPVEYREMLLTDLRGRFGSLPLQRYLQPDLLKRIFGG